MGDNAEAGPADSTDVGDQRVIRDRVVRLVFGGDDARFDEFLRTLEDATPAGVQVILRGSAVTGHKFKTDEPFDADGPGTSDMDVTFVGGDMVSLFREFHIPGVHSVPLSEAHPFASPTLGPLRKRLCEMAGGLAGAVTVSSARGGRDATGGNGSPTIPRGTAVRR